MRWRSASMHTAQGTAWQSPGKQPQALTGSAARGAARFPGMRRGADGRICSGREPAERAL